MEADFESGNKSAKPDIITYNTLLDAWSKSGLEEAPIEAEKLVHHVSSLYYGSEKLDNGPDESTYRTIMLTCWSNSNHPTASKKIYELREKLKVIGGSDKAT